MPDLYERPLPPGQEAPVTIFLRLLAEDDKGAGLADVCGRLRQGETDPRLFEVAPGTFDAVPGKPFAYWVSSKLISLFALFGRFDEQVETCRGMSTLDDFRFIRCWWEVDYSIYPRKRWVSYSKGEENVPFYDGVRTVAKWIDDGSEVKAYVEKKVGSASRTVQSQSRYFHAGLTWVRRTHRLCLRPLPKGTIFSGGSQAMFPKMDLLPILGLAASSIFDDLTKLSAGRTGDAVQFEPGMLARVPMPRINSQYSQSARHLGQLADRAWSLNRTRDSISETSHAFLLPMALRPRLGDFDPPAIEAELARIQAEIDAIAFDLYGFSEADRQAASGRDGAAEADADEDEAVDDETDGVDQASSIDALLSWAIGVAFGRFDWRLATGEREPPPEPDPFDPLPAKSPGMLPEGAEPFHVHPGILVDDPGHPHDLAHLVEEVLARVDVAAPNDVRRWLQRDFFPFHLQRYSKSRRKAPIYWPLSTASGSYTPVGLLPQPRQPDALHGDQ